MIFTEIANLAKRNKSQTLDLVMITKKRQSSKRQKLQVKANKECFYYGKKRYYRKDCRSRLKKKPENKKSIEEKKRAGW